LPSTDNKHDHQILQAIASGQRVTQRALSSELGVALGLTNLLIRRLVGKGYVKMAGMGTRHVRYLMTPAGIEALTQATRLSLENTVNLYTQTREQIRGSLTAVSQRCHVDASGQKRVVFYGLGDVAEIAYVSLQGTDLTLVGGVYDYRRGRFFDLTIRGPEQLTEESLDHVPYSHVIVSSVRHTEAIRAQISARGVEASRVACL
jgi:DNA-binding MarR family transcriptional regulator